MRDLIYHWHAVCMRSLVFLPRTGSFELTMIDVIEPRTQVIWNILIIQCLIFNKAYRETNASNGWRELHFFTSTASKSSDTLPPLKSHFASKQPERKGADQTHIVFRVPSLTRCLSWQLRDEWEFYIFRQTRECTNPASVCGIFKGDVPEARCRPFLPWLFLPVRF